MSVATIKQQAHTALLPYRRQGAILTAIWCILLMLLYMIGAVIQQMLSRYALLPADTYTGGITPWDGLLPLMLFFAIVITAPLRNGTDRWICTVTGVLTECDCGFLDCSSTGWLWARRIGVTLFANLMWICGCIPSLLLFGCTGICIRYSASLTDSFLPLLTALHLLIGGFLLLILPLRLWCAMAALPLCYLKQPHRSAITLWRFSFRCTKDIWGTLLCNRLLTFPTLLLPVYGFIAFPKLLASEMLLCDAARQKTLPDL